MPAHRAAPRPSLLDTIAGAVRRGTRTAAAASSRAWVAITGNARVTLPAVGVAAGVLALLALMVLLMATSCEPPPDNEAPGIRTAVVDGARHGSPVIPHDPAH